MGQNNANVPFILKVFANIVDTEKISEETQTKAVQILKHMQAQYPPQILQQAWSVLQVNERNALQNAVAKQK